MPAHALEEVSLEAVEALLVGASLQGTEAAAVVSDLQSHSVSHSVSSAVTMSALEPRCRIQELDPGFCGFKGDSSTHSHLEAAVEEEVGVGVAQDHHPLGAAAVLAVSQRSQLVQGSRNIKLL